MEQLNLRKCISRFSLFLALLIPCVVLATVYYDDINVSNSTTTPLLIGGTGTTSTLTLRSTSGVGATGSNIIFQTGNSGATEAMRILNNGNVGIGTVSPAVPLEIYGGGANPNLFFITSSANSDTGASQLIFRHTDASTAIRTTGVIGARGVSGDSDSGQLFLGSVKDGTAAIKMIIDELGNVGIGTTSPSQALEVAGGTYQSVLINTGNTVGSGISLKSTDTGGRQFSILTTGSAAGGGLVGAGKLGIFDDTAAAYRMVIDASGNIGIGTTGPVKTLDVVGTGAFSSVLNLTGGTTGTTPVTQLNFASVYDSAGDPSANKIDFYSGSPGLYGIGVSSTYLDFISNGGYKFYAASTSPAMVTMTSAGNVGIGTVTPNFSFEVQAGSGQFAGPAINIAESAHATGNRATMSFGANSGLSQGWILGQDRLGDGTRNLFLFDLNNSREMMYWSSTGNVGIGTITPNTKLEVAGIGRFTGTGAFSIGSDAAQNRIDAGGGSPQLFRTISASNNYSGFRTKQISVGSTYGDTDSPSDGMIIQGSVGLGTTSPGDRLHVSGGNILLDNSYYLSAKDNGGTARVVLYGRFSDNAAYFDGGTGGTYLRVNDGASPTIFLNPSGNVGVGTTAQSSRLAVNGHLHLMGTAPTVSSGLADCGTSPAIVGNDNVGRVTVGTSTNGGFCSITFATAWTNTPICFAEDETTGILVRATNVSTTSFRITGLVVAADTIVYHCTGYQ